MPVTWKETVRGREVEVFADQFTNGEDGTAPLGPDFIWANDPNTGREIELLDDEFERFFETALVKRFAK